MKYLRVFTIFLVGVFMLVMFNVADASSASLYFGIVPKSVQEGDIVTVSIRVKDKNEPINAVSGVVSFPENLLKVVSISKEKSLITLWTQEPKIERGRIPFEGVVLNPGFQGDNGLVFQVTFKAKNTGQVNLSFAEGSVLANDGLGTNVLSFLSGTNFRITGASIKPGLSLPQNSIVQIPTKNKIVKLPVITNFSMATTVKTTFFLFGKGEPNALTKIVFRDISTKSLGEKFVASVDTKKLKLDEVIIKNNDKGVFSYIGPKNLLAGVYSATPFLVDTDKNIEKPGPGVQLLVSDSKIVKTLVVVINVLGLLIPIVTLCVIIYFIPWYSFRKMRVIKKKFGLEEEKIEITEHQLERQDKAEDKVSN